MSCAEWLGKSIRAMQKWSDSIFPTAADLWHWILISLTGPFFNNSTAFWIILYFWYPYHPVAITGGFQGAIEHE